MERLKLFLLNLITSGNYETYELTVIRKIIFLYLSTAIGIVVLIIFGIIAYFRGLPVLSLADYTVAISLIIVLVYARKPETYQIAIYIEIGLFTLLCYYLLYIVGMDNAQIVWYYIYPFVAINGLGARKGTIAIAILIVPAVIFMYIANHLGITAFYPFYFKIRFISSFLIVSAMVYIAEKIRVNTQLKIDSKTVELDKTVSELRIAEENLRKAGEDLEKRVESRTQKLSDANRKLIQEMEERKRIEETLQESEERFSKAFNTSPGPMAISEIETGSFIDVNEQTLRLLEFTREEMIGHTSYELGIWDNLEDRTQMRTQLQSKGSFREYPVRFITKSRNTLDVMWSAEIITLGSKKLLLSLFFDITDRKRAEEALRQSEEKYRLIAENTADIISVMDMNLRFTYISPSIKRIRGYTVEEAMKMTVDQIMTKGYMHVALAALGEEMELESIGTADPGRTRIMEFEEYKKDGSTLWTEASLSFLRDKDNKATGILAVTRDITDRKRAEEGKRMLEERLQRAEKMEALGTLAGGVAHDLNNVLGIVVGYTELLLMEVNKSSPLRENLNNILDGGLKAAAIVQDMLTLARRGVQNREILNLNRIIADCMVSPEFEKMKSFHPSAQIKTDLEEGLLNISGSSVHLSKSLYNLVSNAFEAMHRDGVVTIKTSGQFLEKPIHGYDEVREGEYIVLTVSDTGDGIPTADLKRIFEPFYTKKIMGRSGTGLGLAIVWGTVKDHHGYINVESEMGKGSKFTLYFPVTREELSSSAVPIPISDYAGKNESILIVDDVKAQRDLASEMLRRLNYNVISVSSGEEAVAYLKEHQADLIVLDMIMDPGMDGLDTYRSILEINPKQKAIIVSGFSETDRVRTAQTLGAGAYVRKPYVIEKLGLAVKKELERSGKAI